LVGTFQSAGVIQSAYNLNNELRVLPISAPTDCPHDSCVFVTISSPAVITEALKQVPIACVGRIYSLNINLLCGCYYLLEASRLWDARVCHSICLRQHSSKKRVMD